MTYSDYNENIFCQDINCFVPGLTQPPTSATPSPVVTPDTDSPTKSPTSQTIDTPSPTPQATPSKSPTMEPTRQPTSQPTNATRRRLQDCVCNGLDDVIQNETMIGTGMISMLILECVCETMQLRFSVYKCTYILIWHCVSGY